MDHLQQQRLIDTLLARLRRIQGADHRLLDLRPSKALTGRRQCRQIKLRRVLLVREDQGEFMLTRDLQEMAGTQRAQAIVLGTYTLANRVMYLSVRLVDPADQTIRAAYEDRLTLDANTLRLLGLQFDNNAGCGPSGPVCPPTPSVLDRVLY